VWNRGVPCPEHQQHTAPAIAGNPLDRVPAIARRALRIVVQRREEVKHLAACSETHSEDHHHTAEKAEALPVTCEERAQISDRVQCSPDPGGRACRPSCLTSPHQLPDPLVELEPRSHGGHLSLRQLPEPLHQDQGPPQDCRPAPTTTITPQVGVTQVPLPLGAGLTPRE
jgi:hypothetical protein